ncbi:MAG: Mut7-C RNAse domain-containing protein [Fervidobacterium sp.]|uniref:Mut7-C RNAse domain-containing protein n=1 Tax=Fervidobacterium sp. TaxID=1871331 RepID=UPI004049129D
MEKKIRISIRFFGSLIDLSKSRIIELEPGVNQTIKDCIERLGVPHTEVYFITLNGMFVKFNKIVEDGEEYFVYPDCDLEIPEEYILTPKYIGEPKFILDIHLGGLARYLRMLGIYADFGVIEDEKIIEKATNEDLIILTKDRIMLKNSEVKYGYIVRSDNPKQQLIEVSRRYKLKNRFNPFTRCIVCNGRLLPIEKSKIIDKIPEKVKELYDEFAICSECEKVYWGGTHYEKMIKFIEEIRKNV